jgi:hypothetical protein
MLQVKNRRTELILESLMLQALFHSEDLGGRALEIGRVVLLGEPVDVQGLCVCGFSGTG